MTDVARIARVSQSTVSHVINKTRKVKPETERAVLDAIKLTGYAGDHVARSLRKGETGIIGLAMSAISNPYFGDLVHAIEQTATSAGYSILLAETHSDPSAEFKAVSHLIAHRVDAIVLAPSAEPEDALRLLSSNHTPAVLVDRIPAVLGPGVDAVGVINREPTARLVDHLAGHGHQRIVMLAGKSGLATTDERVAGFWDGMKRNGLNRGGTVISAYNSSGDPDPALVEAILQTPDAPSALVIGNNQTTITTMQALRRLGMSAPEDVALVAFDEFPWSDLFHPRLTVAAQPVEEIGAAAIELLINRVADLEQAPRERRFEPELHIRESCGC